MSPKEKKAEYDREYRRKNKAKVRARHTAYYRENRDKIIEKSAEYYLANKESIQETGKEDYKKNREARIKKSLKRYTVQSSTMQRN